MRVLTPTLSVCVIVILCAAGMFLYANSIQHPMVVKDRFHLSAIVSFTNCPSPLSPRNNGFPANHAMVSERGDAVALRCADGSAVTWRRGGAEAKAAHTTLFEAASRVGIISPALQCTNIFATAMCITGERKSGLRQCPIPSMPPPIHADCDIIDHSHGGATYIMQSIELNDYYVATTTSRALVALGPSEQPGVLLPRGKDATELVFVGDHQMLHSVSLSSGMVKKLFRVPLENELWQTGERFDVSYSNAYDLFVAYGAAGAYLGSQNIAYVRAFTRDGHERWSIKGETKSDELGFSGEIITLHVFFGGKFATLGKGSDPSSYEVIDLSNGDVVGVFKGWPIAVASEADRILVKTSSDNFSLFEMVNK